MNRQFLLPVLFLLAACSSGADPVSKNDAIPDAIPEVTLEDSALDPADAADGRGEEVPFVAPDATEVDSFVPQECQPGDGCFLDPCSENADCLSGWCVHHLGDRVCSQTCQEECPDGWTCSQVGSGPDVLFICVSNYANLCRPCTTNADCQGPGGTVDVCLDYGDGMGFCGGTCKPDEGDCPWGFVCSEAATVDGNSTWQCLAETGICPCSDTAVELGLSTGCIVENEWGICAGKMVCEEGGLSDCSALTPAEETCNGLDDNCDGDVDEALFVNGEYVNLCDDGNPCTVDQCLGEAGCTNEVIDGGECVDGNPCTVADHCIDGECIGTPVDCDDANPCTDDSCDETGGCLFVPNNADCDDGDPCTVADECQDTVCSGVAIPCDCTTDADCLALEDGDLCNGTLVCANDALPYQCIVDPETVLSCPGPEGPNAPCLAPACDPETGACSLVPDNDGFACDDGDACTIGDQCQGGSCVSGVPFNCNDANPCTLDTCNSQGNCEHTPTDGLCDDGNPCTEGDHCANGECVPESMTDCDDENVCTTDFCLPDGGCSHTLNTALCDDGDPCTAGDKCFLGQCEAGPAVDCNDNNPCTADLCVDGLCIHTPQQGECDDANPCTQGDHCANGLCSAASMTDCDDDNVCTTDFCDPLGGCSHTLNTAPCDDGDPCTAGDQCEQGACVAGPAVNCEDNNPCTADLCADGLCTHTPVDGLCDDGNPCTQDDTCSAGLCIGTVLVDCDDDNICTKDYCVPLIGCVHDAVESPCDDGNACTLNDACAEGQCVGGPAPNCEDGNICTTDTCDPAQGCVYANNDGAACNDGDACTLADTCAAGACLGGAPLECDDGNVCTTDSCDPLQGCLYANNDGVACDDGDPGTTNDKCQDGVCQGSDNGICGDLLMVDPQQVKPGWTLCYVPQNPPANIANMECHDLFDSAGKTYGCWHGHSTYPHENDNNMVGSACQDGIQHTTKYSSWGGTDHILTVCIQN